MKYCYLFLFLIGGLVFKNTSYAQLVGGTAFMQGRWLEVAVSPIGAWGGPTAPAGYHAGGGGGTSLDFSYDAGHDGWTTAGAGSENYYGCYFLPGTPFNGWQVEIDDTMGSGFYSTGYLDTTEGGNFSNANVSFFGPSCWHPRAANTGIWGGNYGLKRPWLRGALHITQVTEVDTNASWAIVTVKFYNTSDSIMRGVYYMATADPDNDQPWPGGSFPTHNHISYQGGPLDRHEVNARPPSIHQDAFSGLATQDCRAKALIYQSWPPTMVPGNNLNLVWAETATSMGGTYYTLGHTTFSQDIAYGLVFNLGNLPPHDSSTICFAWIFSDTSAVDSLYKQVPQLSTLGNVYSAGGARDSVIGCDLTGCNVSSPTTFDADIINGSYRKWSMARWTWSPAVGLSTTVGTHTTVDIGALSGPVTYTITGTPDLTRGSCNQPAPITFYLYVRPCFDATNNGPICFSDTLKLFANGDSTGATYRWFGPGGYTAFTQYARRNPLLSWADTGWYTVVRYVGAATDTALTHVMLKPLPTVTLGSNAPICSGAPNTLLLTASLFATGETFSWTGPNAFASTLQNPSRANPPVSDGGIYKVVTAFNGCMDSGTINVIIDTTPAVPVLSSNMPVCSGHRDTLKLFGTNVTPGVTYSWTGPLSFTSPLQNPMIPSPHVPSSGTYSVTVSRTASGITCRNTGSIAIVIDSTPYAPAMGSNAPICSGNALLLTSTSTFLSTYDWTGPNGFTSASQNPTISPASTFATGVYSVSATLGGCTSDTSVLFVQVDSTPEVPVATSNSPGPPIICERDTLRLFATDATAGVTYSWAGPASFTSSIQNPVIVNVNPSATGIYTVTATLGGVCSSSGITTVTITPTPTLAVTKNNPVCTGVKDTLFLNATSNPGATFTWTGPFVFTSSQQSPFRTPVLMEMGGIYQVIAYLNGCQSLPVNDTVIIRQTPPKPWVKDIIYCQHYDAPRVQAFGDSVLWYPTSNISLGGSLIAPKPPTDVDTIMWYFATQTVMTCRSALDSFKITVHERPIVSILPQQNICPHEEIVLQAINADPMDVHHWSPMYYLDDTVGASVIARPITNITYRVVARNKYGCYDTAFTAITVRPGAVLYLGDSVKLYPGESYQIEPQTNCASFAWFPSAGLNNPFVSNPVATPQINTKYRVEGTTAWGCKATDSISIYVDPETLLTLPNAFVPGTGVNGEFKVLRRGIAELRYFRIWDRWGVKVFETTDINKGWDGTFNGKPQPFGVYIYEVGAVTSSGRDFIKHGNVTLIR